MTIAERRILRQVSRKLVLFGYLLIGLPLVALSCGVGYCCDALLNGLDGIKAKLVGWVNQ